MVVLVRVLQLVIVLGVVMVVTVLSVIVDWLGQDTEKNVCTEVSDLVRVEVVLERRVLVVVTVSVDAKLDVRVSVAVIATRERLSKVYVVVKSISRLKVDVSVPLEVVVVENVSDSVIENDEVVNVVVSTIVSVVVNEEISKNV
jgi:hypothetical protein